jgi:TonB-dependent starch-binding outer membrane protein SusC
MLINIFSRLLKKQLFVFFCTSLAVIGSSQTKVSGVIIDSETSETIIGASITGEEDNSINTLSDIDGSFSLQLPSNVSTIKVSYPGYQNQVVAITNGNSITVRLAPDQILSDVVIVGYGTVKREDLTGSIASVSSDKFNKGAITGAQELLAGKVAGVSITTDGGPGTGARIRIRGESSISASNDPLIVIDGVPLDNGGVNGSRNSLNIINPSDIETMTVLKDASACAIYGNRAAAGVILITTKKGKSGQKLKINYNANISVGKKYNKVDVLSPDEYLQFINDKYYIDSLPADKQPPAIKLLGTAKTDWQDLVYQDAVGTDHNLSFTGAINRLPFRVSGGFTNKDGLLKTDNFKRYNLGVNLNPSFLNNRLQVNMHLKAMRNNNHFADRGAIGNAVNYDPTRSATDETSKYGGYTTWLVVNGNPNNIAPTNPVALLEQRDDNSTVNQYITNANISYRLPWVEGLMANLTMGYDQSKGEGTIVAPTNAAFAFDAINGGGVNNYYTQTKKNSVLESYVNYKKDFNKHSIDLMGGYSWQHFFVDNYYLNSDTKGTPAETSTGKDPAELFLVSLYSRMNYDFKDKYFATLSVRRDGVSRFSPDARWGLFPSAAAAVKLFDNTNRIFNTLKLRAGWGITGQQDIGDYYAYQPRYQAGNPNVQYQFGNQFINTYRANGYDALIKWEETTTYNIAADASIIKDVLSASVDVYKRVTGDILSLIPLAAGTNLTNFLVTNVGSMKNKGIELTINATPVKGWDLSFNAAYNIPKITKLTAVDDTTYIGQRTGGIAGGVGSTIQIHSPGFAPNSFYVYKQKYDETGKILPGQFEDVNGDGIVNSLDFYRYQSPNPKYVLGITNNFAFKSFDFSFAGRANLGNFIYNNVQTDLGYINRAVASNGVLWNIHRSAIENNNLNQTDATFSDHYIEKGNFFRLDHVTLGYNFANIFDGIRIYATVQNPLVVTKYSGLDPEIAGGIDNNFYPRPRTFLAGVSVNF